jgi:hypothetical protein
MSLVLKKSVNEILKKVKQITGKGIEFIEKNDLTTFAGIKMARKNMPSHLIFYKKEHNEVINHLIAHECGHVLRIFSVPEDKRLISRTDDQIKLNALAEIEPEIQELSKFLPFDRLAQIVNLWYDGTVRQVTNLPQDIIIEKWIYDEYPELRPYQLQSIKKQNEEALLGLSPEVKKITPRKFLDVSNIMNYAFFRILGFHFGVNFIKPYTNTQYIGKGKELSSLTENEYMDNYDGDIQMIKKWAEFLQLSNWFEWINIESTPNTH